METDDNPYQPPSSPEARFERTALRSFLGSLIPAAIAVGIAMLIWVVLVGFGSALGTMRFEIPLWAVTLFLSSSISVVLINRTWQIPPQPLAIAFAFAVFSTVFALAEGDTSEGKAPWVTRTVYSTLLALPLAMLFLARATSGKVHDAAR